MPCTQKRLPSAAPAARGLQKCMIYVPEGVAHLRAPREPASSELQHRCWAAPCTRRVGDCMLLAGCGGHDWSLPKSTLLLYAATAAVCSRVANCCHVNTIDRAKRLAHGRHSSRRGWWGRQQHGLPPARPGRSACRPCLRARGAAALRVAGAAVRSLAGERALPALTNVSAPAERSTWSLGRSCCLLCLAKKHDCVSRRLPPWLQQKSALKV